MLLLQENFALYDEDYIPYGIEIEAASALWHKHVRPVKGGMAIAACGNKYLLKAPRLEACEMDFCFSFDFVTDFAGATLYFGYDKATRSGYALDICWDKKAKTVSYTLKTLCEDQSGAEQTKRTPTDFFPDASKKCRVSLTVDKDGCLVRVGEEEATRFQAPVKGGAIGFGRPNFTGEILCHSVTLSAELERSVLHGPVRVEIPLDEGATMPLNVTYTLFEIRNAHFLTATLDGGPQYREQYKYYDPSGTRGQYNEELIFMERPYVLYGEKRFYLSMDTLNTSGPLHWKGILDTYLDMKKLPFSITVPIEGDTANAGLGFGYEGFFATGFASQAGRAEYNFSHDGAFLSKTVFPDTFRLRSPEKKHAASIIEDTVYEAEAVRAHFRRGHYFCEDEPILFTVEAHTDKKYITYKAELQNAFGEAMEALFVESDLRIMHAPLPVGVYRIALSVLYGGENLSVQSTVFEVYDKEGKRCPPLESGLPLLFSTPSEQKYLDRDKFDPWSPAEPKNSEHFYALCCFTGYVGERKRVWQAIKKFGRKWYAWVNFRTYGDAEGCDCKKHLDAIKNADYLGYPIPYAFNGSLRCDYMSEYFWNGSEALRDLLDAFLDGRESEHAREKVGYVRGGRMTQECVDNLYKYYQHAWYAYAGAAIRTAVEEQNEILGAYNPCHKRAYYGPVTVYASMLRSYSLSRCYGFEISDYLSDTLYTGFCQLEDYPAACAYQTLRGPFAVGTVLSKVPRLVIYPEQYASDRGGCIDGHVKFANPPLGKYEIPIWYSTTHAREFVYNTAVKTADGYRFWDTYGFMHRDFDEAADDAFIRDWRYVRAHKPHAMKRSPIFFAEFAAEEDTYETDFVPDCGQHTVYNPSEEGVAHVYEVMRLCGLPMGAFAAWDALDTLRAEDTDLIVLPSTASLSEQRLQKLRRLHAEGVSLLAVSRVDGLEDLFGVSYAPQKERIYTLSADGKEETTYPYTEVFLYRSAGAEIKMTASGMPVFFKKGNAVLLNLAAYSVGRIHFKEHPYLGRATNSDLFYEVTERLLRTLVSPTAEANRAGITLFEDEDGKDLLLAIDYSRHDPSEIQKEREYTVTLHGNYKNAVAVDGRPMRRLISESGRLDGITLTLRRHESALVWLIP